MIIFGERQLRKAIHEFSLHYHHERNHQGLGNKLIQPDEEICRQEGEFRCREPADCCVTTIAKPHKSKVVLHQGTVVDRLPVSPQLMILPGLSGGCLSSRHV